MAGVRITHPTARNVRFTVTDPNIPYDRPYQCNPPEFGGCGAVHLFKTHHLYEKAKAHFLAAGFELANEVLNPPTLGIGLGPQATGLGPWGNIPIIRRGEPGGQ